MVPPLEETSNRGNDLRYDVNISLEEAFKGLEKMLNILLIKNVLLALGSGAAKGSKPIKCNYCSGRGKVRSNQGFFTIQQTCPQCSGYGEIIGDPCKSCNGNGKIQGSENVTVKIPKELMMGLELDYLEKEKRVLKGGSMEIFIFSYLLIIIIFSKDQKKIYIMNFQLLFLTQH